MADALPLKSGDTLAEVPAVVLFNDKWHLELAATEFIFPITSRDDQFKLYFRMKPYQSHAVKKFYDKILPRRIRRGRTDLEFDTSTVPEMEDFFKEHFLGLIGVALEDNQEPTHEMLLEWLAENPYFYEQVFRLGYDAWAVRAPQPPVNYGGKVVLLFQRQSQRCMAETILFSREYQNETSIKITGEISKWTELERRRYEQSTAIIESGRTAQIFSQTEWDVIEGLFNSKILALEGALINGVPCTAQNKTAWVDKVPFCLKVYLTAVAWRELDIKKA